MIQDFKFALRHLLKAPGFTATAVLTLALAIGVNSAIFALINSVVLHPVVPLRPNEVVNVLPHARTRVTIIASSPTLNIASCVRMAVTFSLISPPSSSPSPVSGAITRCGEASPSSPRKTIFR